jgi:15-cis-phytoene synthase
MKLLFDHVSSEVSKLTTRTYSTSFSWGIYFLSFRLRKSIYAIYGFVRLADEIVDSFHGYDKTYLLNKLKQDTYEALDHKISCNPILNSFQEVVHQYQIDRGLIDTFLLSMEMDLTQIKYDTSKYEEYILGSAEVVGLMCLHVFTEGNKQQFETLKPFAMKLGAAFQKVNFLRDMKQDYQELGRVYFPGINWEAFNSNVKKQIESDIEKDFKVALEGIKLLPASSRKGVYLAFVYYKSLFRRIRRLRFDQVMEQRVRISNGQKLGLMVNSLVEYKMKMI